MRFTMVKHEMCIRNATINPTYNKKLLSVDEEKEELFKPEKRFLPLYTAVKVTTIKGEEKARDAGTVKHMAT